MRHFWQWTDLAWASITPRQVAQFKAHLSRVEDGEAVLSPATIRRILGTLKAFYGWMWRCGYVERDPTFEVQLPKLPEPEAGNLTDDLVDRILAAAAATATRLGVRNLALIAILQHGIRAEAATLLNVGDFDGIRLRVRQDKADSKGVVPLDEEGQRKVAAYLA